MSGTEKRTFEEIQFPVPNGHISGKWWGPRDKDPVIAIHGWQDNAGTFDKLVPLLPENIPVLCIDMPGHGHSSHYPQGQFYYIWWDYLVVLRRLVLHLRLERVSLIGHSLGGAVCFLYAATYPDQVDKLVSIDIVGPRVEKPQVVVKQAPFCIERFLYYDCIGKESVPCYNRENMLNILEEGHNGTLSRENCEVLLRRGMKPSPSDPDTFYFSRDSRLKVAGLATLSKEQVLAFAEKIRCEYLNIRAESGLKLPYPEIYTEVLDIIKKNAVRFEAHNLKGQHHIHLENAPAVAEIINPFLLLEKQGSQSVLFSDIVI